MPTGDEILYGIVCPAIAALLILLAAWRPWSKRDDIGRWGGPIAWVAALLIGYVAIIGSSALKLTPKQDAIAWLPIFAGVVLVLALVDGLIDVPGWARGVVPFILVDLFFCLLVHPQVRTDPKPDEWAQGMALAIAGAVALTATMSWLALDLTASRRPGPWVPLVLVVVGGAISITIAAHSIRQSKIGMSLPAAAGAAMLAALWARRTSLARGAALAAVLLPAALLIETYLYAEGVSLVSVILLIAAPGLLAIGEFPSLSRAKWWERALIQLLVILPILYIASIDSAIAVYHMMRGDQAG